MSKICPQCGKELDDSVRFCDSCGSLTDAPAEEPAAAEIPVPAEEPAPAEEAEETLSVAEEPVEEESVPYAEPILPAPAEETVPVEEPVLMNVIPKTVPTPEVALPLQEHPVAEKKNKHLGLGIGVTAGIILLIAAIVTIVILLIPKGSEAKTAVEKYAEAYINSDFAYYFSHDYYTVFNTENVDDNIKAAQDSLKENAGAQAQFEIETLSASTLSAETVERIKKQLESSDYKKVDQIEDIQVVVAQTLNKEQDQVSIDAIYTIKVDGEWYVASYI